jgi:hypothetical protein
MTGHITFSDWQLLCNVNRAQKGAVMTPLGTCAQSLALKGMRIFPCKERGKEPAIGDNLRRASTDLNLISGWWQTRNFNIGLATGEGSGVWVLDIDGDEGEETLRKLEAEHGELPKTVEAITGKGRHLYFRWASGIVIRNKQVNPNMPGIDIRGNGGYVLAPPSIHPSGRVYAWSVDSGNNFADAPEWLLDLIAKGGGSAKQATAYSPEQWTSFLDDHVDGSRRSAAIARISGVLLRRYIEPEIALGLVRSWNESRCHPPLDGADVERIMKNIVRRETARLREES